VEEKNFLVVVTFLKRESFDFVLMNNQIAVLRLASWRPFSLFGIGRVLYFRHSFLLTSLLAFLS
jgi:hypothetical protein